MENAKKFYEALKTNPALAEKLKNAGAAHEGKEMSEQERRAAMERDILPIIKEADFDVTVDELEAYTKSLMPDKLELDDDELEAVAGGSNYVVSGGCVCVAGGGGGGKMENGDSWGCACVAYGQGGDGKSNHTICICPIAGAGDNDKCK